MSALLISFLNLNPIDPGTEAPNPIVSATFTTVDSTARSASFYMFMVTDLTVNES